MIKDRSIKTDFMIVVLFATLFPFLISISFLWLTLKSSYEKADQVQQQIQHTQELEILDLLHKSFNTLYMGIQAPEMSEYFLSTSDTEPYNREKLKKHLITLNSLIPFEKANWIIYGSHGNILFTTENRELDSPKDTSKLNGATYNKATKSILLSLPLYYNSSNLADHYKRIYAYVTLSIPLKSIKNKFKDLENIEFIPTDLSALTFKASFNIPQDHNNFIFLFFFYIFIFILFNLIAVYFGIKILQEKIIEKLKQLTQRVANEIEFYSNSSILSFDEENLSKNEINSLSFIFYKYFKYVYFLQREIEKSSQLAAVGNIAHTLAHDLRKPFSNTALFVEQVEEIKSYEEIKSLTSFYKPLLKNSIQYVEHLLKDIMDAGVTRLQLSDTVAIEDILSKSLSTVLLSRKNVEIELEYNINLTHYLCCDEFRLIRIFVNLITNAMEAMNYKGKIWFHAQETSDVEIIIGNNNSYISKQDINYLFEPFFTKNKKNGTGLGLSIAQKIIALHNGQISCRSDEEMGVEFVLNLPKGDKPYTPDLSNLPNQLNQTQPKSETLSQPPATTQETEVSLQTRRIFIIDDDVFIGRSWKRSQTGAEIIFFTSPEEFLAQIGPQHPWLNEEHFIISDFYFGTQSSYNFYEFILKLREFYTHPLFLSTDAVEEDLDWEFLRKHKVTKIKKSTYTFSQLEKVKI